ncbi:MAG: AsmA family protein, partial [Verrucomicrobiota bacterium]
MKKVVRTFLIVMGLIVGIAGIGLLAANLYIQSKPTQLKIERKLSETLRMPLEIRRTSLTPWGGLSITGITVPQAQPESGGHFVEAQECSIHFQLLPLFQRKLVIDGILLDEPKVVWTQNASGRWVFPETASLPAPEPSPVAEQPAVPMETPSASPAPESSPAVPSPET